MDILGVTETWLTDMIFDPEILPTNFIIYRKDRNSRGGGVMIAISNKIHSELMTIDSDLEVLSVKIGTHSSFVLCIVYMPPNSNLDQYQKLFNYLTVLENDNSVVIGDFNLPDINWNTLSFSSLIALFCDLIYDLNFTQHN